MSRSLFRPVWEAVALRGCVVVLGFVADVGGWWLVEGIWAGERWDVGKRRVEASSWRLCVRGLRGSFS